jgi:L-fucose mutarotase
MKGKSVLKGIDPLLSPELLHALAAMGHGDEIVLVDCHFPAVTMARRLIRLDGATLPDAARAVLSLLPLDDFIDEPVAGMQMVDTPDVIPDVQAEVFASVREAEGREVGIQRVERFDFYERARNAFAVVFTGETRPYGCVLFTKGLVT